MRKDQSTAGKEGTLKLAYVCLRKPRVEMDRMRMGNT